LYQANVLPVLIASPSDVEPQRQIIREEIYTWNFTDSVSSKTVLLPVGWETHSAPEIGIEPQEQINQRLVDRCDLLVGVFWTRLGTPTSNASSGTVEEIERFLSAGKPVLLYFSQIPVMLGSIDASQFELVNAFRERVQTERLGMYDTFSSDEELRRKFSRHLRHTLNENPYVSSQKEEIARIDQEIEDSGLTTVTFPQKVVELLRAAASGRGILTVRSFISGTVYTAEELSFETGGTGRDDAELRDGVQRMSDLGLIEERNFDSGVYFVTNEGYQAVDRN